MPFDRWVLSPTIDIFGRSWPLPPDKLCPECRQIIKRKVCRHRELTEDEVANLGGGVP